MPPLANARILVVEDEFLIALHVQSELEDAGATVIGPVASIADGLRLVEEGNIDVAVLNVTIADGLSFPIAAALDAKMKPFIFVTSSSRQFLGSAYVSALVIDKPIDFARLIPALVARLTP